MISIPWLKMLLKMGRPIFNMKSKSSYLFPSYASASLEQVLLLPTHWNFLETQSRNKWPWVAILDLIPAIVTILFLCVFVELPVPLKRFRTPWNHFCMVSSLFIAIVYFIMLVRLPRIHIYGEYSKIYLCTLGDYFSTVVEVPSCIETF